MKMNSLKPQKKKYISTWTVTDSNDHSLIISDNRKFTVNDIDSLTVTVPGKSSSPSEGNRVKVKVNRKRIGKGKCSLSLKKPKLQSLQHSTLENNIKDAEYINKFAYDSVGVIETVNNDREYEQITYNESDEQTREGNEITEEHKSDQLKAKHDEDDDIKKMMDKMSHSDSDSDVSSIDLKVDSELSKTESGCNRLKNWKYTKKKFKLYEMYTFRNGYGIIIHLPEGAKFHFEGKLQVTLLYGAMKVFGHKLEHISSHIETLKLYSPRRCMQLCITGLATRLPEEPSRVYERIRTTYDLFDLDQTLRRSLDRFDTLLLVERLFDKCSLIMNHYCDNDIFLDNEITTRGDATENMLGCFTSKIDDFGRKGFTQGHLWSKIKPKKRTIICGGKGVGKSTLFKFLINSNLSDDDAVLCIDLDPGQTEFTPPGCVSAVVRREPLLGPNFTNITTPVRMAYIGHVNVALDPVRYMKAVEYVVQGCRDDPELSQLPWFVNTMGFNKGIGLDIMINIIKLVKPDNVVQITSSDKSRNYEIELSAESVQSHPVLPLIPAEGANLKYNLHSLKSCSKTKGIGFQGGYTPAELREFMIISYFAEAVSFPYCNLNAVQPRWIHFSKIHIAVDGIIQPDYILKAINGNLVGLCSIDGVQCKTKSIAKTNSNDCFLKLAIQPEVAPCFGCGLVRGIDVEEEKIHVITPISNEDLDKVNCLFLGSVGVPSSFYLKQKFVNVPSVYTDIRGARNIRSVKNQFKYLPQLPKNRTR